MTEARVFVEEDMEVCDVSPLAGGTAAVLSFRGPAKDTPSEDAAVVLPIDERRGIMAVADGVGGQPLGRQAAAIAVKSLAHSVREGWVESGLRGIVLDSFERANAEVTKLGVGAATTLSVVEIDGDVMRAYHAGDSMIVATGQRGRIKLKTVSHSPIGYAVEAGYLDEDEAIHHEDRHLVSNMVGSPDMHIEVGPPVRLNPRDTIVVASDGLFDNLLFDEIVEIVRAGRLERSVARLGQIARERMVADDPAHPSKPDDMTLIAFRPAPGSGRRS